MKATRKLIPALVMLLVSAVLLSTASYAWFSMNRTVTATNMQVTAKTDGSIVITNSALPTAITSTTTVASSDASATELSASTHDSTWATYTTGLKYNTNPEEVDAATGLKHGATDLTFTDAINGGGNTYYSDYVVYIAASGDQMVNQDITCTIINGTVATLPGATSIDFYYASVTAVGALTPSDATFAGTLNLAGLDPVTNDASATKTSVIISNVTIPEVGTTAAIAVMMRVYIDGALKDTATTTFIKNADANDITDQNLGVTFVASTH